MRPRNGDINTNKPRRTIIGRVYEKFKPIFEWRREDDHDNLLLYLPGFRKEFIKVTTEDPNILRVRGERLVAGNKWNQFREDFKIPNTCKMNAIHAKFNGGILTITMPKRIINPPFTTIPPKPQEPMKRTIQDTNPSKASSSTLNTTPPSQPPQVSHDGLQKPLTRATISNDVGKNDKIALDKAQQKGALTEKINKRKVLVKMGVAVMVVVVAIEAYVYIVVRTSSKGN